MRKEAKALCLIMSGALWSATSAVGQINSYPLNQTVTSDSGPFTLDVDGDFSDDYTFEIYPLSGSATAARVVCLGDALVLDSSTFGYPDALNCGDALTGSYSSGNTVLGTDVGDGGLFTGEGLMFLGLNLNTGSESHQGWISLEVSASNDTITLYEVGYSTEPSNEIEAGQMSDETDQPLCDFIYTVGTQFDFEVAAPTTGNGLPAMAPLFMSTFAGDLLLSEDSCFGAPCPHLVSNPLGMDTVTTCIDYLIYGAALCVMDTSACCVTQVWNEATQAWQITETVVGVESSVIPEVMLYPVPTRGPLYVQGDFSTLRIFDLSGREVLLSTQTSFIDVSSLATGGYLVEIVSSKGRQTTKIQVVR